MASYHQFTQDERIMLSALLRKDFTQTEIAREIGKSQSAISRELNRHKQTDGRYHAGEAKRKCNALKEKIIRLSGG